MVYPSLDRDNQACRSGIVGSDPGLSSMPSTGDRASGVLPCPDSPVHVSSPSFVDSPERSLRHKGGLPFKSDPLIVSIGLVNSGILGLSVTCISGRPCSTSPVHSRPHNQCIHLWMWGGLQSPLSAQGVWSSDQSTLHINCFELELETVFLILKRFQTVSCMS